VCTPVNWRGVEWCWVGKGGVRGGQGFGLLSLLSSYSTYIRHGDGWSLLSSYKLLKKYHNNAYISTVNNYKHSAVSLIKVQHWNVSLVFQRPKVSFASQCSVPNTHAIFPFCTATHLCALQKYLYWLARSISIISLLFQVINVAVSKKSVNFVLFFDVCHCHVLFTLLFFL